jgi:hypothetical protein
MKGTYYRGKMDGDIRIYLKNVHNSGAVSPAFIGYEPFKQLWELGVINPGIASIRVVRGIVDEHYKIVDEKNIEGVILNAHSGREGLHNTQDILTSKEVVRWEISGLNPKVYRC